MLHTSEGQAQQTAVQQGHAAAPSGRGTRRSPWSCRPQPAVIGAQRRTSRRADLGRLLNAFDAMTPPHTCDAAVAPVFPRLFVLDFATPAALAYLTGCPQAPPARPYSRGTLTQLTAIHEKLPGACTRPQRRAREARIKLGGRSGETWACTGGQCRRHNQQANRWGCDIAGEKNT